MEAYLPLPKVTHAFHDSDETIESSQALDMILQFLSCQKSDFQHTYDLLNMAQSLAETPDQLERVKRCSSSASQYAEANIISSGNHSSILSSVKHSNSDSGDSGDGKSVVHNDSALSTTPPADEEHRSEAGGKTIKIKEETGSPTKKSKADKKAEKARRKAEKAEQKAVKKEAKRKAKKRKKEEKEASKRAKKRIKLE